MKDFFKKILCIVLACGMFAGAYACDDTEEPSASSSSGNSSSSSGETDGDDTDISTMVSALNQNEYTVAGLTSKKFGLSDASAVGVEKTAFESENKYPLPDDSELANDLVIDLTQEDFTSGAYQTLKDALERAKAGNEAGKKAKIKLPEDTVILIDAADGDSTDEEVHAEYVKSNAVFVLRGYDGLYIEGKNTEIRILCENSKWKGFFHIYDSSDIRIHGINVDYANSPIIRGTVKSCTSDDQKDAVTVKVDDEYRASLESAIQLDPEYVAEKYAGTNIVYAEKGTVYNGKDAKFPYCPIHIYTEHASKWVNGKKTYLSTADSVWKYYSEYDMNSTILGYDYDGEGNLTVYFKKSGYKTDEGTVVSLGLAYYVYNAFLFTDCREIYAENVTVNTCPGFAYGLISSENIYMNRANVAVKSGDSRLITSTGDGFHIQSCIGDVQITNSRLERTNDDILNVKSGFYMSVLRVNDEKKTVTLDRYSLENAIPQKGEVLEFYNAANMQYSGKITVKDVKSIGMNLVISTDDDTFCASAGQKCVNVSRNPKLVFKNNIIGNKKNRGILIQCRDGLIENNTFQNIANGSMMITTESYNAFNEAMLPKNITIRNNKFINNNFNFPGMAGNIWVFAMGTENLYAPAGTITGIQIENNYFSKNGNNDLSLYGVGDSVVKNNLFYDTANTYDESADTKYVVGLNNSKDITITQNYSYSLHTDRGGVGYTGEVKKENIYLTDNKNIDYFVDITDMTPMEIHECSGAITIDGELTEWADFGTELAITGKSYPDGSSADSSDYSDYFGVETLKLTWKQDGIYFAFKVKDDKLEYAPKEAFWNKDTMEVFFTDAWDVYANADVALLKNIGTAFQLALAPKWSDGYLANIRTSDSVAANFSMFKVHVKETAGGYQGEAFIPFEALPNVKVQIDEGKAMAMTFVFHDAKRGDREHLQLSNAGGFVEYSKLNSAKMPRYLFVK